MSSVDSQAAGLTAIVRLDGDRLQLVTHPVDGRIVAFEDQDAAFAFAVSLECTGAPAAGTVAAPIGVPVHMLEAGISASDVVPPMKAAA